MSDLVSWLTEILDEDEAITREADVDAAITEFVNERQYGRLSVPTSWVLADIAAKRAIIADYKRLLFDDPLRRTDYFRGQRDALEYTVKHLAEPYADRPGYREEWKP